MIIYSADYIGNHYHELKKLKASFKLLFILGLGFGLIMLQPDFGSGVVMACSIIVMLIVSPFPFKYFVMRIKTKTIKIKAPIKSLLAFF